jgi:hypothetical protein
MASHTAKHSKPPARDRRAYNRQFRAKNRQRLLDYWRAYRKANRLHLNALHRAHYDEAARAKKLEYYHRNREHILNQKRAYHDKKRHQINEYRIRNAKKLRAANSRWHRENRDRIRERKRIESRRRRENLAGRIACNIRSKMGKWMKRGGVKPANSEALLGCSFEEFRCHIERQFKRSMTWQNYGCGWHIDHIIPCSAFDLTRPAHVRQCFHFTNLRPLWARANLRKGAKITDPQFKLLL